MKMWFDTSCLMKRYLSFPARCSIFAVDPVMKLSIPMTRCPSASSRSVRCEPRKPAPPVTTEIGDEEERVNIGALIYWQPRRAASEDGGKKSGGQGAASVPAPTSNPAKRHFP